MRKSTSSIALLTVFTVGLSACGDTTGQFYNEAGANLDEGAFGNPTMTNTLIARGELSAVQSLQRRFENEVPSMVTFAFNSSRLDDEARAALRQQANWIRQFPEMRFSVFGHADAVGSRGYNQRLGLRRARAVVSYLATQGISRSRLQALSSFGETQPVVVTQGRERRNRRTVTEVSGFGRGQSRLLDGKYAEVIYRDYVSSASTDVTIQAEGIVE